MPIVVEPKLLDRIKNVFLRVFPATATKGILEIYYGDAFAKFPMKFMTADGKLVKRVFKGWESPEMLAQKELTNLLGELLDLRKNISALDGGFWNHFMLLVENGEIIIAEFLYQPELDEKNEAEVRYSIGDELYEKYQRERNGR